MATTTTPNLGLIKPERGTHEPMSNWPDQNETNNLEILDDVLKVKFGTYEPTISSLAGAVDLGTGFIEGKYVLLGQSLVLFWVRLIFGSGFSIAGSGVDTTLQLTAPFQIDFSLHKPSNDTSRGHSLGRATFRDDNSALNSTIMDVQYRSSLLNSVVFVLPQSGGGTFLRDGVPSTISAGDRISMFAMYFGDF